VVLAILFAVRPGHADDRSPGARPPQIFRGLGVQIWPATQHRERRDALLRTLQARYVRVNIGATIADDELADHESVRELLAAMEKHQDAHEQQIRRSFRDEMNALGITLDFVYWQMPRKWSKEFGVYRGQVQWRCVAAHLADYANLIAANLLYAATIGFHPQTIELSNEPDGSWNTFYTPAQYDELLVLTRRVMDAHGLTNIGIEGPGTSMVAHLQFYLATLERTGDLRLLSRLSVHEYDREKLPVVAGLSGLHDVLRRRPEPLPVVVTEFGSFRPEWDRPPYDAGPGQRSGTRNAADSNAYAVSVVGEALALIADGAPIIFMWQLEDEPWGNDSLGLLDLAGRARPVARALGTVFSRVRPGATIIRHARPHPGVIAVTFATATDVTIGLANVSSTDDAVRLDSDVVPGGPAKFEVTGEFPAALSSVHLGDAYRSHDVIRVPGTSVVVLRKMP